MNTDDLTESIHFTDETGAVIMNNDKPEITLKADVAIDEETYQHIKCHLNFLPFFVEDGSFMDDDELLSQQEKITDDKVIRFCMEFTVEILNRRNGHQSNDRRRLMTLINTGDFNRGH
ncbi:MAG: hypothetical protein FE835_16670 [Gammaproteobacteria bacterium]|nr:hypothetical protein [Gammaproteobacteria bacterium]